MRIIRRALARAGAILRGHQGDDADLHAEMTAHLDMATAEYVRRGMSPTEARRRALVDAGGLTQATEATRDVRGLPWLETFVADARYALRHFRKTPLSTVTMVLVLSLGLGTNVVLFTVINSVTTMPPPGVAADDALVRIRGTMRVRGGATAQSRLMSWPEIQAHEARADVFSGVSAYATEPGAVGTAEGSSSATSATIVYVTPNYFSLLGVRPELGTTPVAEPSVTHLSASPTAMVSFAMWKQRFGGSSDLIGQTVRVNDVPVRIVGVAPERFMGTGRGDAMTVWVPLAAYPLLQKRSTAVFVSADTMFLNAVAKVREGVSPAMASPIVAGISGRIFRPGQDASAMTAGDDVMQARVDSGSADVVPMLATNDQLGDGRDTMISVAASGGFALLILLITCTNVSALMVGLASARRREIGVRLSLGAPRERLIRQLLTESVLLALTAAAIGLVATTVGIRLVGTMLRDVDLVVDWRVTAATCAVAVITGVLFGLSPALHATRVSIGEVLKSSATAVAATRSRLQRALVVAQVALTQPLLVGLGVGILTMASDPGAAVSSAAAERIVEIEIDTWAGRVSNTERSARIGAAVERIAAMPGVESAMPLQMGTISIPLTVHSSDRIAGLTPEATMRMTLVAAPRGYFQAFGIPFTRGRDFTVPEQKAPSDDGRQPLKYESAVIGSDLAQRLWGSADPIGRRLTMQRADGSSYITMTVVGVVDAAVAGPSDVSGQVRAYVPYSVMNTGVLVRTAGPATPMLGALRSVVAAEAPQMPIVRAQTIREREVEQRRSVLRASGAVAAGGVLALLLSAIGLYAVVAFAVSQRTREIGIRTALGASSGRVVRMFFANGLVLSGLGLALGLPLSIVATRMISSSLDWPLATSPMLGVGIGLMVLAVASVAAWIPARRASRIDPLAALRAE